MTLGPYLTPSTRQHTTQVSLLVSDRDSCPSHAQHPRCVSTCAHLCTHGHVALEMRCVSRSAESDCAIDRRKCGLKSMKQYTSSAIVMSEDEDTITASFTCFTSGGFGGFLLLL